VADLKRSAKMKFRSTADLKWKDIPLWFRAVWIVAIVNVAGFWLIAFVSGGDAVNGKEEGGRYFLANSGRYTEVSKVIFEYSRIHAMSVWITTPITMLGMFWFVLRKKETTTS
jgi:hypothetical protein